MARQHSANVGSLYQYTSVPSLFGISIVLARLRPIAVQHVKKKWFMTVLLLQIEQPLMQIAPPQQIGCFKGRLMVYHIWGVRSEWESARTMALLSIDYQAVSSLALTCLRPLSSSSCSPCKGTITSVSEIPSLKHQFSSRKRALRRVTPYSRCSFLSACR